MIPGALKLKSIFVKCVYVDHNSIRIVKQKLKKLPAIPNAPGISGLNIGAGQPRVHPRITNLDIFSYKKLDIVSFAEGIPCDAESLVISQVFLEHVKDPLKAVIEIQRSLKSKGKLIEYQADPSDYWRFTDLLFFFANEKYRVPGVFYIITEK